MNSELPTIILIPFKGQIEMTKNLVYRLLIDASPNTTIIAVNNGDDEVEFPEEVITIDGMNKNIHQMWNIGIDWANEYCYDGNYSLAIYNNDLALVGMDHLLNLTTSLHSSDQLACISPIYDSRELPGITVYNRLCKDTANGSDGGGVSGFAFVLKGSWIKANQFRFPEQINWWFGDDYLLQQILASGKSWAMDDKSRLVHLNGGSNSGDNWKAYTVSKQFYNDLYEAKQLGLFWSNEAIIIGEPMISLIHASRGRPEKMVECRDLWMARAKYPIKVEHIFAIDQDDTPSIDIDKNKGLYGLTSKTAVCSGKRGCVEAWNTGAAYSTGQILVQVSDDYEPPQDWDEQLIISLNINESQVLFVHDGSSRDDVLATMAILTRKRYVAQGGWIFHPYFTGMYSDDYFTIKALTDGVARDRYDLVFTHHHPMLDASVPVDAAYERQNSQEQYTKGKRVLNQLVPEPHIQALSGLKRSALGRA
jgi:hypothetical protein